MDATLVLIDSDAELLRARALVDSYGTRTIQPMSLDWRHKRACRVRGNARACECVFLYRRFGRRYAGALRTSRPASGK